MGKMSYKTLTWLFVALICGTVAAFVAKQLFFSASPKPDEASLENPQRVLVANVDLKAGTELSAQNVRFDLVPEDNVPRDAIYSFEGVSGRKVVNDINESSPIRNLYDLEFVEKKEVESPYNPPGYAIVPLQIESVVGTPDQRNIADLIPLNKVLTKDDRVDLHVVLEESGADRLDRQKNSHLNLVDKLLVEDVAVVDVLSEKRFSKESGTAERFSVVSLSLKDEIRNLVEEQALLGKLRLVLKKTDESLPPATGDSSSGVFNSPSVSPNALLSEGTVGLAAEPSDNGSILAGEFQFQNQRNDFPSDSSLESKSDVQALENGSVDSVSESDVSIAQSDEESWNDSPEFVIPNDFSPPVNDDFLNESTLGDSGDLIRSPGEATENLPTTNESEAKGINGLKSVASDLSSVETSLLKETPSSQNSDADDNVRRYYRQFQTKTNQASSDSKFDVSVSRPKFSFPLKSNPIAPPQTEVPSASPSRTPASSANSATQGERRSDSETPTSAPMFRPRVQMQNQLSQAPK